MSHVKPLARRASLVVQEFAAEIWIYDLKADKAFHLNETSALIWQFSNGDKTISEIAAQLSQKLHSPVNEEFVWLALERLGKEKLVENEIEINLYFRGISRRNLIRKVGLETMVALPVISSLIVPKAVNAQSPVCSTAAPGGLQCRCNCSTTPNGATCGNGLAVDFCNSGCTCTRTSASCYSGTNPVFFGTALGTCS